MSCLTHQQNSNFKIVEIPYVDLQATFDTNSLTAQLDNQITAAHQEGNEFLLFQKLPLSQSNTTAHWMLASVLNHLYHEHLYQEQSTLSFVAQQISQNPSFTKKWLQQQISTEDLSSDLNSYFAVLTLAWRGDDAVEEHLDHIFKVLVHNNARSTYDCRQLWLTYAEHSSLIQKERIFNLFVNFIAQNPRAFSSEELAVLTEPFLELNAETAPSLLPNLRQLLEAREKMQSAYFETAESLFELYLNFLSREEEWSVQDTTFLWDYLKNNNFYYPNTVAGQKVARHLIKQCGELETLDLEEILVKQFSRNEFSILGIEFLRQHERPQLRQGFLGNWFGLNSAIPNQVWLWQKIPSLITKLPLTDPSWQAIGECYQTMSYFGKRLNGEPEKRAAFQTNLNSPTDTPYFFTATVDTDIQIGCLLLQKLTANNQAILKTSKGELTTTQITQRILEAIDSTAQKRELDSLKKPYLNLINENPLLQEALVQNPTRFPHAHLLLPYPFIKREIEEVFKGGDGGDIFFLSLTNQPAVQAHVLELIKEGRMYLSDDMVRLVFGLTTPPQKKILHTFLRDFTPRNLSEKNTWLKWCFEEKIKVTHKK